LRPYVVGVEFEKHRITVAATRQVELKQEKKNLRHYLRLFY